MISEGGEVVEAFLEEAGLGIIESQDLEGSQRLPLKTAHHQAQGAPQHHPAKGLRSPMRAPLLVGTSVTRPR